VLTLTAITLVLLITSTAYAASPAEKIARTITATWACQEQIGVPRTKAANVWAKHSPGYRRYQLRQWRARLEACRQQNWQAWLPDKWRRIGICETQLNWRHYNSSYEGAFGFATSSWDAFKPAGYPDHASQATPWQQFQVALAIYRRYGLSGWGCRNA
jgi:hypothetical protein